MDWADAQGTLVITFGWENTEDEIGRFIEALDDVVNTLRKMSPLYEQANQS